jgi:[ribosomal protein S18]-alanine N-acetyltransferase
MLQSLTPEIARKLSDLIQVALPETSSEVWSAQTLMAQSQSSVVFVDTVANPCGVLIVQPAFETADIHMVAVHPDHHRKGIARRLLADLFMWCEANQVHQLLLEVGRDNASAVTLYKNSGFQQIHVRPDYYKRPNNQFEDALILEKRLVDPVDR